jgi:DNA-directed RNA polymerase III subunit RPC7
VEEQETDEDVVPSGRPEKKIKKDDPTKRKGQKRGLEAEDDYGPDMEEEGDDAEAGEEAEQDSAFSESDDGDDDYNAERYFEDGERDDGDDGGGGEEDVL